MRRIREVLRLKHELGLSERAIATSTGMSKSAAHDCIRRADKAGLTWEQASELADEVLESRLFVLIGRNEPPTRAPIELAWVRQEMRKAGVTLQLVWTEYCESIVASSKQRPYQYSQFCELYRRHEKQVDVVMRQTHRAGEKLFVDYSGKRPVIWDRETAPLGRLRSKVNGSGNTLAS